MPRLLRFLALALLTAVTVAACGPSGSVAARIDDIEITTADVDASALLYRLLGEVNGQGCGAPTEKETIAAACDRFALSNVIQERLVDRYAKAEGLAIEPGSAEKAVDDLDVSLGEGVLDQSFETYGVTREDLVGLAQRLLLFQVVRDALAAAAPEDELRNLYDSSTEFTQIHAKHILVEDQATAEQIAADATRQNFGALAERYSIDTGSAANGGDLGPIAQSSLDPDFAEAALALQPGEISDPVQTQFGWHVILLVSVDRTPFEKVRLSLQNQLATTLYADWLQEQYANSDIEVNPRYGRLNTETGEVQSVRTTAGADSASPSAEGSASP